MQNYDQLVTFLNTEKKLHLSYTDFFQTLPRFSIGDWTERDNYIEVRFSLETTVRLYPSHAQFVYKSCLDSFPMELESYDIESIVQTPEGYDVILKNDDALVFKRHKKA